MSSNSENVKRWRENTKRRMVASLGGKCCLCGYNRCIKSLDFHHLDPSVKEASFGYFMAHPAKWGKMVEELRKCVLLCSNCHGEVHCDMQVVPSDAPRFNEQYAEKGYEEKSPCPICGSLKPVYLYTCSKSCAAMKSGSVEWDHIDLIEMKKNGMSNRQIAASFGISRAAVLKRLKVIAKGSSVSRFNRCKKPRPSLAEIESARQTKTLNEIGFDYGVTGDAVWYWIKQYRKTLAP
jgi:transposase